MAILAKQGWCILMNENTLLHLVYKARYFPNSFFDSCLGKNPSFAWRGIWKAKRWLEEGCIWWVGDGKHIRI